MNRDILISCLPCFLVLCGLILVLRMVLALGCRGGSWIESWRRISRLHQCQKGGVQSLAFVLTMPIFIMVLLLIVQVSQLMIALLVVHLSAFAGARAASVWLPAAIESPFSEIDDFAEVENRLADLPSFIDDDYTVFQIASGSRSNKLWKVRVAVIQSLAPLAPSRDLGVNGTMPALASLIDANQQAYSALVPASQSNSRIPIRLANKLNYVDANTQVVLEWRDGRSGDLRDSVDRTSYNVRNHTCPDPIMQTNFRMSEIGWQDPITVYVTHQFALLPGPGRLLAARLVRADGLPDRVSPRIRTTSLDASRTLYTTQIQASATITCEGLKSVKPLLQPSASYPGL